MGISFLIGAILVLVLTLFLIYWIFKKKLKESCGDGIIKIIEKIKKYLFWNVFIRYTLQTYLQTAVTTISAIILIKSKSPIEVVYVIVNIIMI